MSGGKTAAPPNICSWCNPGKYLLMHIHSETEIRIPWCSESVLGKCFFFSGVWLFIHNDTKEKKLSSIFQSWMCLQKSGGCDFGFRVDSVGPAWLLLCCVTLKKVCRIALIPTARKALVDWFKWQNISRSVAAVSRFYCRSQRLVGIFDFECFTCPRVAVRCNHLVVSHNWIRRRQWDR